MGIFSRNRFFSKNRWTEADRRTQWNEDTLSRRSGRGDVVEVVGEPDEDELDPGERFDWL